MLEPFIALIIACGLVMLISLAGVIFIWGYLRRLLEHNLHYLVSFAAGVFLVVSLLLSQKALLFSESFLVAGASVLLGFFLIHLIHLFFPEAHHHHEHECETCEHGHTRTEAVRILASDAIHNVGDGILLAPAFVTNLWLGVAATVGVLVHEAVQEISEFFVLRECGYTTRQALRRNVAVSSTILIGAIGGFFLASTESMVGILLGIAAGGFLHVVVLDIFPHSFFKGRSTRQIIKFMVAALLGATVILATHLIAGHHG